MSSQVYSTPHQSHSCPCSAEWWCQAHEICRAPSALSQNHPQMEIPLHSLPLACGQPNGMNINFFQGAADRLIHTIVALTQWYYKFHQIQGVPALAWQWKPLRHKLGRTRKCILMPYNSSWSWNGGMGKKNGMLALSCANGTENVDKCNLIQMSLYWDE